MVRTYSTAVTVLSAAVSISSSVVNRPRLNRTASKAASRSIPMASSTSDGSIAPELQALPVEAATGSMRASTASASAPSNPMLAVLGSRRVTSPFSRAPPIRSLIWATSRSRRAAVRADSGTRSAAAMRAASPNPAIPAVFSDPDRSPSSWPPPCITARSRARLCRVPTRAPTPPGPQILWLLTETRSHPHRSRSNGKRPAIWVASQCSSAPAARTGPAISPTGFSTPVSLLAAITDTISTSSPIIDSTASGATKPPPVTGITSSLAMPWSSSHRAVWRTEACSTADIRMRGRSAGAASAAPVRARLLASVAPAVNTTPEARPPTRAATCSRASSTVALWRRPKRWAEEALPVSARTCAIASATLGSSGAEAL